MKKIIIRGSQLKRMIALIMAVVMLLTIVVVDSGVNLFAADEDIREINITQIVNGEETYLLKGFDQAAKYKLVCDAIDGIDSKKIRFVCFSDKDPGQNLATSSDAAQKFSDMGEVMELKKKADVQKYALYYPQISNGAITGYRILGTLKVVLDTAKPVISDVTARDNSRLLSKNGYYLLNPDERISENSESAAQPVFEIKADDGGDESASGIDRVVYMVAGSSKEIELKMSGSKYLFTVPQASGIYSFKAYDKAGNASAVSDAVVIKKINGTRDVTDIDESETQKTVDGADFLLKKDSFDITVKASETAGDDSTGVSSVDLKLVYMFRHRDGSNVTGEADFKDGRASINVPAALISSTGDSKGISGQLVMMVKDDIGRYTYAFDEQGYIVFVDDTPPVVEAQNIRLGDKAGIDSAAYEALPEENRWAQNVTLDVAAVEDNSYIESGSYSYETEEGTVKSADFVRNVEKDKYTYVRRDLKAGSDAEDGIPLSDGIHKITFSALNYMGDTGSADFNVYIDNAKPDIVLKSKDRNGEVSSDIPVGDDGYYVVTANVGETIDVDCTDELSGIDRVTAIITDSDGTVVEDAGSLIVDGKGSIKLSTAGKYTLHVEATDHAGNVAAADVKIYVNNVKLVSRISATVHKDGRDFSLATGTAQNYTNGDSVDVHYEVTGYGLTAGDVSINARKMPFGSLKFTDVSKEFTKKVVDATDLGKGMKRVIVEYTISGKAMEGVYDIYVTANRNAAPDLRITDELHLAYDITAPTVSSMRFKGDVHGVNGTYYYMKDSKNDPVVEINVADNSDTAEYEVRDSAGEVVQNGVLVTDGSAQDRDITIKNCKPDMVYTISVYVRDKAGNIGSGPMENGAALTAKFAVDSQIPVIKVENNTASGKLTNFWNSSDVNVKVQAEDNFYVREFRVNGTRDGEILEEQVFECPDKDISSVAETVFSYTEQGVYKLAIAAYDEVGNKSAEVKTSFVIDAGAPVVTLNEIDMGTKLRSKTMDIVVSDDYGIKADNVVVTQHYATYDGKTSGSKVIKLKTTNSKTLEANLNLRQLKGKAVRYYFTVTAVDNAGHSLEGGSYRTPTYYIDATAPKVAISPVPNANGGYYKSRVEFDVDIKEQFNLKHTLSITDKNSLVSEKTDKFEYDEYLYVASYNTEGVYDLDVRVTDAIGNSTVKNVKFVIDKTKPVVTLGSVPSVNNSEVTLPVNITDNMKGSKYTVHVIRTNAAGSVVYDGNVETGKWNGTSFDKNMSFSEEGDYTVTVTAVDKAGNKSMAASSRFRIDRTAPVINISGMNDSQSSGVTATISVDEAFSFSFDGRNLDSGAINVTITRKTDGTGASNVATLSTGSFSAGNPHTASYSITEDGEYTITANATDLSGNKAATVTRTFKVDANAPVISVMAVDRNDNTVSSYASVGSAEQQTPNYVDMSVSVKEPFFTTDDVKISVAKDGKDVSDAYFADYSNSAEVSTGTQRFDEDGVYTVKVTAKDELGNEADEYNMVFTVDNTPPTMNATKKLLSFKSKSVADDEGAMLLNADDFADIANEGYEALWDVNDTSVFTVDAKMDGVELVDFSDMTDGYHRIEVTVKDEVGHISTQSLEFTYDGTAPRIIITGVDDGDVVRDPFLMTIGLENDEDEITSIVINGQTVDPAEYSSNNRYEMQVDKYDTYEVEVTATDKAGNIATTFDKDTGAVFTFKLSEGLSTALLIIIIISALLVIGLFVVILIAGRKKKDRAA